MAPNFRIGKKAYGDAHMRFIGRARRLIDVTRSEMSTLAALSAEVRRLTDRFLRTSSNRLRRSSTAIGPEGETGRPPLLDSAKSRSTHAPEVLQERRESSSRKHNPTASGLIDYRTELRRMSGGLRPVSTLLRSRAALAEVSKRLGRPTSFRRVHQQGRLQTSGRVRFAKRSDPAGANQSKTSPKSPDNKASGLHIALSRSPTRARSREMGSTSRSRERGGGGEEEEVPVEDGPLCSSYVHGALPVALLPKSPRGSAAPDKPIVIPGGEALSPRIGAVPPEEHDPSRLAPLASSGQADHHDLEEWTRFNRLRGLHLPSARKPPEGGEEITLRVPRMRNAAFRSPHKKAPRERSCKLPSILNIQMTTLQPSPFDPSDIGSDGAFIRDMAEGTRGRSRMAFVRYEQVSHTTTWLPKVQSKAAQTPRVSKVVLPQFFENRRIDSVEVYPRGSDSAHPPARIPERGLVGDPEGEDNDQMKSSYGVHVGDNIIASVGLRGAHDVVGAKGETRDAKGAGDAPGSDLPAGPTSPRSVHMQALQLALNRNPADTNKERTDQGPNSSNAKFSQTQRTDKATHRRASQDAAFSRGRHGGTSSLAGRHPITTQSSNPPQQRKVSYELLGDRPTDADLVRLAELLYRCDVAENSVGLMSNSVKHKSPSKGRQPPDGMDAANATWPGASQQHLPGIAMTSVSPKYSRTVSEDPKKSPLHLPTLGRGEGGKGARAKAALQLPSVSATPVFPEVAERSGSRQWGGVSPLLRTYPLSPRVSAHARALPRVVDRESHAKP